MELEALPRAHSGVLEKKRAKWKVQVHSRSTILDPDKCEMVLSDVVSNAPFVANERWDIS